jgi:hypothetical protein
MDQAYKCYCKRRGDSARSQVVEEASQRIKDEAILRLARIQNNKEPGYINGHPKSEEKTGQVQ